MNLSYIKENFLDVLRSIKTDINADLTVNALEKHLIECMEDIKNETDDKVIECVVRSLFQVFKNSLMDYDTKMNSFDIDKLIAESKQQSLTFNNNQEVDMFLVPTSQTTTTSTSINQKRKLYADMFVNFTRVLDEIDYPKSNESEILDNKPGAIHDDYQTALYFQARERILSNDSNCRENTITENDNASDEEDDKRRQTTKRRKQQ